MISLQIRYLAIALALGGAAHGHFAAWHKGISLTGVGCAYTDWLLGMYCLRGNKAGVDDQDTNAAVVPMAGVCSPVRIRLPF